MSKTQTFAAQPHKVRDAQTPQVIFYLSSCCLSIQGLCWQNWSKDPHPFPSTQYFSNLKKIPVYAVGDEGLDPKLVVMEVTG